MKNDELNEYLDLPDTRSGKLKNSDLISENIEAAKYVVLGNVDAGKSSFVGVMEKNVLDDGNGYARSLITNLKHEQSSGRTSSHSFHYIIKNNEITTLIDLCGHEKYLKTTMFGVTGLFCDYGILVIGLNMGISKMTIEHIAMLISNKIPFIIILTKFDICPENIKLNVKKDLSRIANKNKKELLYIEEEEQLIGDKYLKDSHQIIIDAFQDKKTSIIPVIMVSNKTGHNVEFVRELVTSIKSTSYLEKKGLIDLSTNDKKYSPVMYFDSIYNVPGIGIVLCGVLKYGNIHLGQKMWLGPINNTYIQITIKSIHNCIRQNVNTLEKDNSGSIGIRLESKNAFTKKIFRKGIVASPDLDFLKNNTCYKFNCEVAIFNHSTTINNGYQSTIHCGTIRQTGLFIMDKNITLRSGCKQVLDIKFVRHPEFILPEKIFMFRDGHTKGIGRINSIVPHFNDSNLKYKKTSNKHPDKIIIDV